VAFVRCSKRRGGTPTGERAAISARRAEARIVDYASAGVPPSFFFFVFLGFAGLDRDERPDSTAGFAPRSLESKRSVPFSCRLPQTSDADRIARTISLGFAVGAFARGTGQPCRPNGFAPLFGGS
jgi:hypothetical protein